MKTKQTNMNEQAAHTYCAVKSKFNTNTHFLGTTINTCQSSTSLLDLSSLFPVV